MNEIVFDGNQVYSDDKLRGRMKKVKEPGFFNLTWLGGKTTYTEDKWLGGQEDPRGDRGRIEDYYLDSGYVTARVGQPRISYTDGKSGFFKKKPVKLMKLEIPVTEGDQYKMGELKFEGLTVLKEDYVRSFFKTKEDEVYNDSRFKKAYEKLRDVYGSLGYFQWTGGTDRKPDAERKVVDVTVKMEEDKQYFLGKLNFIGNDSTRDKVIRREIYMNEGDVFNTEALKMSIKRVNQLGYFKAMESAPGHPARARTRRTRSTSPSRSRSRTATSSPSAAASRATRAPSSTPPSRPPTSWARARRSRSTCRAAAAPRTTRSR